MTRGHQCTRRLGVSERPSLVKMRHGLNSRKPRLPRMRRPSPVSSPWRSGGRLGEGGEGGTIHVGAGSHVEGVVI